MADFPHLRLPFRVDGTIRPSTKRFSKVPDERTRINRTENRKAHGQYLSESAKSVVEQWNKLTQSKKDEGVIPTNENDIPVFLKVDTDVFRSDSLTNWGIEVISEEDGGYIIGASSDQLITFQERVNQFLANQGKYKDTAAKIWELVTDDGWRVAELLKGELGVIWPDIEDDEVLTIELGVSCYVANKKEYPNASDFDSEEKFEEKVNEYKTHETELQVARDKKQIERESEIERYVGSYSGMLHDIWDNDVDAIYFKISISGKGLKDLVQTYQYLFEVKLDASYSLEHDHVALEDDYHLEIIAPEATSTKVCVIDSGIQESHRLIQPAIDPTNSRSYVDGDATTADYVKQSGHGTKVAGAVLYPTTIPKAGTYQLQSIIQNARILDKDNRISQKHFGPALFEQILQDYSGTKIFNLSVSEDAAYNGTHMPALAASIDKLSYEDDVLFILAAGNLKRTSPAPDLGISEYLQAGQDYPSYLDNKESKIANPGVSYFAITVGSVGIEPFENADYKALAGPYRVSPFSRTGLGMWGCIKPDVVEFGGDLAKNKLSNELVTNSAISPELVNSTMHGASAVGKDSYGTSFSTPKVSHIASRLQSEHPNESAQMYRALIIQSARLPDHCFHNPTKNDFCYYGYGLPDVNRALNNSETRITFIQDGSISPKKADIYRIKIPEQLKGEGKEFRILVEVTLTFTARTRSTRKGSHSYLSNWLEWQSSKYNESFNSFRNRTIEYLESDDDMAEEGNDDGGADSIKWIVRENPAYTSNGINRNLSTAQKSWAIIEPQQFAEEFSIAVVSHFGWDKNLESEVDYALCVSFEILDTELNIYQILAEAQVEIEPELEIEI